MADWKAGKCEVAPSSAEAPAARILLVDDDLEAAVFAGRALSGEGSFDVTHCADPADAVRLTAAEPWDLVITEVGLAGMSGHELLDRLRGADPAVPVAVVTSTAAATGEASELRDRADDFAEKPVRSARLVELAAHLVGRGRAARAASEVVLAIGARLDDVEIGAGGTLLAHRRAGHQVSILTLGGGADGRRESEWARKSTASAKILGANLYLEELEDSAISEASAAIAVISRTIEALRPTVLYTHSVNDTQRDHRNAHRAAIVAAERVNRVCCFQSLSATVEFTPSLFVGIDTQLPAKLAAIGALASEGAARGYLEPDLIQSTARYWGRFARSCYAEPFEVIRHRGAACASPTAKEPHVAV